MYFHGTTRTAAQSIQANGFEDSAGGNRGEGVYFTDDWDQAWAIARMGRGGGEGAAVVGVALNSEETHGRGDHGPWGRNVHFHEYCIPAREINGRQINIYNTQ